MRTYLILLAALLAPATQANAQVTVDLRALDALPAIAPATPAPHRPAVERHPPAEAVRKPAAHPAVAAAKREQPAPAVATNAGPVASESASQSPPAKPAPAATAAAAPLALPTMSAQPPSIAQIKPIQPASSHSAAASSPASSQTTATRATASRTGIQVSFAPGKADLSQKGAAAIKQMVASTHTDASVTYNVVAYAAGTKSDPSVARRLSLARALAVRKVLLANGVDASDIYLRAMGSNVPSGTTDRVDVTPLGRNDPPQ